jgi:hypothetical protein
VLWFGLVAGGVNCGSLGFARDDKGESSALIWIDYWGENCSSLGFARDDKGESSALVWVGCWGYARDDKGRGDGYKKVVAGPRRVARREERAWLSERLSGGLRGCPCLPGW